MINGLKSVPAQGPASWGHRPKQGRLRHIWGCNRTSLRVMPAGFHFYPHWKEREKSVWNKLIFVNQHSKMLEFTRSFVNQITTYFRISFNELDIQKRHLSPWFAAAPGGVFLRAGKSGEAPLAQREEGWLDSTKTLHWNPGGPEGSVWLQDGRAHMETGLDARVRAGRNALHKGMRNGYCSGE